jgi:ankyrin repeat protein
VAALLLENGAEIDPLDDEHRTCLIWAAGEGHPITVKLLLDHGADCMVQDGGD